MQLMYPIFYRNFGLLRVEQLQSPRLTDIALLELPKDSVLHYVTHQKDAPELNEGMPFISKIHRKIMVDHITALKSTQGGPMRTSIQPLEPIRHFHQKHKLFMFFHGKLPAYQAITDPVTLVVENYCYLPELYKYTAMQMNPYNEWYNIEKTVWENIAQVAEKSHRAQFVMIDIPELLPSYTSLEIYSRKTNLAMLSVFDTPEKLFLLELWKWMNDELRSTSILNSIQEAHYDRVNLIFQSKGKWALLNMGYLFAWLKSNEHKEKLSGNLKVQSVQLQKLFLKFVMQVNSITHQAEQEELDQIEKAAGEVTSALPNETIEPAQPAAVAATDMKLSSVPSQVVKTPSAFAASAASASALPEDEDESEIKSLDELMPEIDKDLEALAVVEKKALMRKDVVLTKDGEEAELVDKTELDLEQVVAAVEEDLSIDQHLHRQLDQLAEYGVLSASDYRNATKQIANSELIKDPYGTNDTIVKASTVEPTDLVLDESDKTIKVADEASVLDKSMLESSLKVFDRKYVTKVMKKDILGAVRNIQKAGIIVTDYDIERDKSITGEYDYHVIQVKPIDGVSSTIRFKLPSVKEDGSFTANGNKYLMRKQRSEQPIRKINPTTVALTSYYGRTFVSRNAKKVNDPIAWLAKQVIVRGMGEETGHIRNVSPAFVFDNTFEAPAIYSALANHFKSFSVGNYDLIFDHRERMSLLPKADEATQTAMLQNLEKDGHRLVGANKGHLVTVGPDDTFYEATKDGAERQPIGTIYGLCLLDELQAPVSYVDLKVFAKDIPLGIVFGYLFGFKTLLKYLEKYGLTYRTVEPRKAKNLEAHEWVIQFEDIQYVFSRRNTLASLILAGFNEYEKVVKKYPASDFDHKNVYLNVLESRGISTLYLRELEMMDSLYVDNITRDILAELHEPTTFKGLLFRSVEMLNGYTHPDAQDMSKQRIKGYERFAGAVYRELVVATRTYKSRNIRGKSKLEMNPYAVWTNIMQDPSVKLSEEINPINNLKEAEAVTYVGEGGRSKEGMNRESRAFHKNDIGVISEATVDSGDVGINTYMVPDPKFTSLRGISSRYEQGKDGAARMLSTSALLAPGAINDD